MLSLISFNQRLFPPHTATLASDGQRAAADGRRPSGGGGLRHIEPWSHPPVAAMRKIVTTLLSVISGISEEEDRACGPAAKDGVCPEPPSSA
eukprot:scaffold1649_cov134-Isochrysis_galbana.AAC.2